MKQNLVGNVFSVVCLSALLVACGKQEQAVSAQPAVQVARADFDMAANELADTRLLAPFDGYVQQTYIERHQTVRPQQAVVTFIDLSQVKAEVYVPEDMAVALRAGVPDSLVRIRFDRLPGRVFTPSATYLTQSAAGNNLSFRLTALVDNTDRSLLGGMAGTLSVSLPSTSTSVSSLAIP